jgi:hypothetical protein
VIDTAIKALSFEDADLDLGHVQPTPALGRVVELEAIKIRPSLIWREELVERSRFVRVELVHHNPDAVRIRVVNVCVFDNAVNPLSCPSLLSDFDGYPPSQRFSRDVESLFPVAFVPMIDASDRSRFDRERIAFVSAEWLAGFVETDDWTSLVVRFVVDLENAFHLVDEISVLFGRYLPITGEVRLQGVF